MKVFSHRKVLFFFQIFFLNTFYGMFEQLDMWGVTKTFLKKQAKLMNELPEKRKPEAMPIALHLREDTSKAGLIQVGELR